MMVSLHKNATTTPGIRQRMSGSDEPAAVLALRYGVSEETARKWKRRDSVQDLSATPHTLQTTLTPAQEAVVVQLRRLLLLPLDDLLAVCREFLNPDVSRSGLDRCLRRHGVSTLKALLPKTPAEPRKTFKTYEPGFLHVDLKYLPQMADETTRRYLFVAIDRATRWVFVRILPAKTAANARRFLRDLHRACPIRITKILTDNGKEFTDRLFASRARAASGEHAFDQLCAELGIEHRLTPPKSPQTNGMVERFNGRIADVLKTNRFDSALDLEQTLMRYVALYNTQLPQSVLGSRTPMQAMKDWHKSHPHLFVKSPRNLPGRDTYLDLSGRVLDRVELDPALHQNSIRHLAVRGDGLVGFAMQWEGEPGVAPPLLGLHRLGADPVMATAPLADEVAMQGYTGSVAFAGASDGIAITSPRGGRLHRFDAAGAFRGAVSRADICGLAPLGGGYLASDGLGGLMAIGSDGAHPLARHGCAWDNHIVAL